MITRVRVETRYHASYLQVRWLWLWMFIDIVLAYCCHVARRPVNLNKRKLYACFFGYHRAICEDDNEWWLGTYGIITLFKALPRQFIDTIKNNTGCIIFWVRVGWCFRLWSFCLWYLAPWEGFSVTSSIPTLWDIKSLNCWHHLKTNLFERVIAWVSNKR